MSVVASQSLTRKQAESLLQGRRWFAAGDRDIASAQCHDVLPLPGGGYRLGVVKVQFSDGSRQTNVVVVGDEQCDCANEVEAQAALFQFVLNQEVQHASHGIFEPTWKADASGVRLEPTTLRALTGEQSNTSFVVDGRFVFKLIRRVHAGPNPEVELLQALAARGFPSVPKYCGSVTYRSQDGERLDLVVVTERIDDAQDGWQLACQEPERFAALVPSLGKTLAQLHNALGTESEDEAFAPEPFRENERVRLIQSITKLAEAADFPRAEELVEHLVTLTKQAGTCIRGHGDLHLGQTLRQGESWFFLDFEGEPTRSLEERRAKTSPLKDVAGMLRSFSYAEASSGKAGLATRLRSPFIDAYRSALDVKLRPPKDVFSTLLAWYEIEKALYELDYEKRYRPDWVYIPRASLEHLCDFVFHEPEVPTRKVASLQDLEAVAAVDNNSNKEGT